MTHFYLFILYEKSFNGFVSDFEDTTFFFIYVYIYILLHFSSEKRLK